MSLAIKKRFRTIFFLYSVLLILVISIIITFTLLNRKLEEVVAAGENRYQSFSLAQELRQSSDDLTRMIRAYGATGDKKYKDIFDAILDIRDGKTEKPENYSNIFWDFYLPSHQSLPPLGENGQSIEEEFGDTGFSPLEYSFLSRAKEYSDKLVKLEREAMSIIDRVAEGAPLPGNQRDEAILNALKILYSDEYLDTKVNIFSPINSFFLVLEERTKLKVLELRSELTVISMILLIQFAMLIATAAVLSYNTVLYNKKSAGALLERNIHLIDLQNKLIDAETREKIKLSHLLHDGLSQRLTGLNYYIKGAADKDSIMAEEDVRYISGQLKTGLEDLRGICKGLYPADEIGKKLNDVLEEFCLEMENKFNIACLLTADRIYEIEDERQNSHIINIVKEAVFNGAKHSKSENINISLKTVDGRFLFEVKDSGRGFDRESANSPGIGLDIIQSRIKLLKGTCSVNSEIGKGTCLSCSVPLDILSVQFFPVDGDGKQFR